MVFFQTSNKSIKDQLSVINCDGLECYPTFKLVSLSHFIDALCQSPISQIISHRRL